METQWLRGQRCESGACIEVTRVGSMILMRDSKVPDGPVLEFTLDQWQRFTAANAAGSFEPLDA